MTEPTPEPVAVPNADSTSPSPTPEEPTSKTKPKTKKKRTRLYIFAGVFFVLLLIAAGIVAAILLLNANSTDDSDETTEATEEESDVAEADSEDDTEAEDVEVGPRRIAYMKNNNIWVMETDGTNKAQITMDGDGDATRYTALDWKEQGTLGYAKCSGSCVVYTYDLDTATEAEVHTPPPFTQSIADITWSHDTSLLGVLYTKADYSYAAYVVDDADTSTTIATFGIPPARGGGYSDGLEVLFSPDDTKVVVLNTIVDFGDDTIIATEVDGTPITAIADATHPTFDDSNGFYFIADGKIKKYNFTSGTTSNILTFGTNGGYNLKTSPDRNFIAFWNEDSSGETHLYFHDVAGSPALIADGFANADWLDNSELVALKTTTNELGMGYLSDGLSKVERVGGAETVLEATPVYNFEIEPL